MKYKKVLILLQGQMEAGQSGRKPSAAQSPEKKGRVTISGKDNDDIPPKTLKSILTQAGLA